jgi:hypothetical protein
MEHLHGAGNYLSCVVEYPSLLWDGEHPETEDTREFLRKLQFRSNQIQVLTIIKWRVSVNWKTYPALNQLDLVPSVMLHSFQLDELGDGAVE